jgi:hypothetical protein
MIQFTYNLRPFSAERVRYRLHLLKKNIIERPAFALLRISDHASSNNSLRGRGFENRFLYKAVHRLAQL